MPSLRRVGVVLRRINTDREPLPSLLSPPFMKLFKIIQVFLGTRYGCGPEMEKHSFAATGRKSFVLRGKIGKRKIRSGYGNQKPGLNLLRKRLRYRRIQICARKAGRLREGLDSRWRQSFLDRDPVIDWQVAQRLKETAGPVNSGLNDGICRAQTEKQFFAVFRQESCSHAKGARLAALARSNYDPGSLRLCVARF